MKPRSLILLLLCLVTFPARGDELVDPPNVLLILVDDLGKMDLGIEGSTFHETPRIDALAKSGVRFTDFYAAHPVCSPTRAALMTGKVPQRVGITDWIRPASEIALPAGEVTLGQAFQEAGYQTAYLGKWHLGHQAEQHPSARGFEWTKAVNGAGQPASYEFPYLNLKKPGPADVPDLANGQPGDYLTDALTTEAIRYLKQRDVKQPFFLCLSHYAVHTPIQPPRDLLRKYQTKVASLSPEEAAKTLSAPFGAISRGTQSHPGYAAMIENLDTNIGRLLDGLQELGLTEQTIIVFTSDNGGLCTLGGKSAGPTSNLPYRAGKGWTYEGGIRIPTYIACPGTLTPSVANLPATTCDIYPTLLDLCGLKPRPLQRLDGQSLRPAMGGASGETFANRTLTWYYPHAHGSGHQPSAALRKGKWKLICYLEQERTELYNLELDPGENQNLSSQEPQLAARLEQELREVIKATTK